MPASGTLSVQPSSGNAAAVGQNPAAERQSLEKISASQSQLVGQEQNNSRTQSSPNGASSSLLQTSPAKFFQAQGNGASSASAKKQGSKAGAEPSSQASHSQLSSSAASLRINSSNLQGNPILPYKTSSALGPQRQHASQQLSSLNSSNTN